MNYFPPQCLYRNCISDFFRYHCLFFFFFIQKSMMIDHRLMPQCKLQCWSLDSHPSSVELTVISPASSHPCHLPSGSYHLHPAAKNEKFGESCCLSRLNVSCIKLFHVLFSPERISKLETSMNILNFGPTIFYTLTALMKQ